MTTMNLNGSRTKIIGIFFIIILLTYSCNNAKSFRIEGNLKKAVPTPVKLYLLLEEGATLIDSTNIEEGSTFMLKGKAEHPSIYLIKYFNGQSIYLVIHPGDNIKITIDNLSPEITYYIEGSADSKLVNELIRKQKLVLKKVDQLSRKLAENPDDIFLRTDVDFEYAKLISEHKIYTINFIHSHPKSLSNILALYQNFGVKTSSIFDRYSDIEIFDFVDSNLIALYPGSVSVKVLDRQVAETKEQIIQKKYFENTITEGRILTSFQNITVSGDTVTFPNVTGKLNILYFWASWNSYSMKELININNLFKSNANEINIISVSLDNSVEELKMVISNDSISLPVVCDYKYWESELVNLYSIRRIPALILANRDGLVIAKDIFSNNLTDKLSQYIKSVK
jgi:hypothetical protein